jgi:hypothetical protein
MDVVKMVEDLRNEREQIEEAIMALERLARCNPPGLSHC